MLTYNNTSKIHNYTYNDDTNTKYKVVSNVNSLYLYLSENSRMTRI